MAEFKKAAELKPFNSTIRTNLASVYLEKGLEMEAIRELEEAVRLDLLNEMAKKALEVLTSKNRAD
jgi:Flp pilus assembly protein TadD